MRRCLLLISLLFASLALQAQALKAQANSVTRYAMDISFREAGLTGVCLLKDNGPEVVGSTINEFGIKGFDFILDKEKGKVKLKNVMKFLNKWYIKRVLRNDLAVLLREYNTPKKMKKRKLSVEQGLVCLENIKYHITYKFKPLNETER